MPGRTPILLTPQLVEAKSSDFAAICGWPFKDSFVGRLLRSDVPQRALFGHCRIWVYRDPGGETVGFGTLDVCDDYARFTGGQQHAYIPLLAVNPLVRSLGYGTSILQHLVGEAAILALKAACHDVLFLDVYETSVRAVRLYTEHQFQTLDGPIHDPVEDKSFLVMGRRVVAAGRSLFESPPL